MSNDVSPYGPVEYGSLWPMIAIGIALLVIAWYGFVFWVSRRRKQRLLANLPPLEPTVVDMEGLRKKYLALIDEVALAAKNGQIKSRTVHQKLSVLLRFFAQEAHGLRAFSLTLSDLRQTRYHQLTSAIESYYVPEFHEVIEGDVGTAIATAREVVTAWS
ncbi:MAG: hypothetical protein WBP12_00445 [Candidatus Saccharimonas sp.]